MILNVTKKFSTEDRTNKFKPPRQEFFVLFSNFKTQDAVFFAKNRQKFTMQKSRTMTFGR